MICTTVLLVLGLAGCAAGGEGLSRSSFPQGFVFGTASSAYQYEGAVKTDGRGSTIWDAFAHTIGKIQDFSNADVADDQYNRIEEDIELMADMGIGAYRFSIAWSRIFPNGTGEINQAGVDHYNRLINTLLAKGIEPYVTLFHWDLPQALEDKYLGWLDRQIITDFANYSETCFKLFGDRVKTWITINEPNTVARMGYYFGFHAPGRCSNFQIRFPFCVCWAGNSATEPYIAAHNLLIAHATVAEIYRQKYKDSQKGSVGMAFNVIWFIPASDAPEDVAATQRAQEFQLGWFLDPLYFGDYPSSMRSRLGDRLPKFAAEEAALVKGSMDFVGINHYTTYYGKKNVTGFWDFIFHNFLAESDTITSPYRDGKPIADRASSEWLFIYPVGMRGLMNYIKERYNKPPVIITENGMDDKNSMFIPMKDTLNDQKRIGYHRDYLSNLSASIMLDGCDVRGYFVWSLLDNWEWTYGYKSRFGLYYVNYRDNRKRYAKNSVQWFKNLLRSECAAQ